MAHVDYKDLMDAAERIQRKAIEVQEIMEPINPVFIASVDSVSELFAQFTHIPDPAGFDPLINSLKVTLTQLSPGAITTDPISGEDSYHFASAVIGEMKTVSDCLLGWRGRAAETFKEEYTDKFSSTLANQFILTAALRGALEAEKAMWKDTREDIAMIAGHTLHRLDHLLDCKQKDSTMIFTVVASIAAVVAAAPTAGTSLALGFTAVGAAAQVVAAVQIQEAPTLSIGGDDVPGVLRSMREAITKQIQYVNETEDRIARYLRDLNAYLDHKEQCYHPKRPELTRATKANVRSAGYMGESQD